MSEQGKNPEHPEHLHLSSVNTRSDFFSEGSHLVYLMYVLEICILTSISCDSHISASLRNPSHLTDQKTEPLKREGTYSNNPMMKILLI